MPVVICRRPAIGQQVLRQSSHTTGAFHFPGRQRDAGNQFVGMRAGSAIGIAGSVDRFDGEGLDSEGLEDAP